MDDKKDFQELMTVLNKCPGRLRADFLRDILTPNELRELCQRWRIVVMLAAGLPQRTIARTLRVSLCKITRGSRELKKPDSPLLKALKLAQ